MRVTTKNNHKKKTLHIRIDFILCKNYSIVKEEALEHEKYMC